MEKSFSQRMGLQSVRQSIQIRSMDSNLRRGLWNVYYRSFASYTNYGEFKKFTSYLWTDFFKKLSGDPFPKNFFPQYIKEAFFKMKWYRVYDFLEYTALNYYSEHVVNEFIIACNMTLAKEMSAYRFVGARLVPVTSEQEVDEITEAVSFSRQFTPHLDKALELLSKRTSPDYANSIKESILAVEAVCQLITGSQKATLGETLRQLENKLGSVHPALREAFNKLYGYTSDAQGIRHALLGESGLDIEEARFMLVACSAFINYLVAKAGKAGIELS